MKSLELLFEEIEEKTKTQQAKRDEYIKLVRSLLDKFKKEIKNNGITFTKQLSFHYVPRGFGSITFDYITLNRTNIKGELCNCECDKIEYEKFLNSFNFIMNKLINDDKIEYFINYLSLTAIPLFLQDQHIPDWSFKLSN